MNFGQAVVQSYVFETIFTNHTIAINEIITSHSSYYLSQPFVKKCKVLSAFCKATEPRH